MYGNRRPRYSNIPNTNNNSIKTPAIKTSSEIDYSKNDNYMNILYFLTLNLNVYKNLNIPDYTNVRVQSNELNKRMHTDMYGHYVRGCKNKENFIKLMDGDKSYLKDVCKKSYMSFGYEQYEILTDERHAFKKTPTKWQKLAYDFIFQNFPKYFNVVSGFEDHSCDIINHNNKTMEYMIYKNYITVFINEDIDKSEFPELMYAENIEREIYSENLGSSFYFLNQFEKNENIKRISSEHAEIDIESNPFLKPSFIVCPSKSRSKYNKLKRPIIFYDLVVPFIYYNKHHNYVFTNDVFTYAANYINTFEPFQKNDVFFVFHKGKFHTAPEIYHYGMESVENQDRDIMFDRFYFKIKFKPYISPKSLEYLRFMKEIKKL